MKRVHAVQLVRLWGIAAWVGLTAPLGAEEARTTGTAGKPASGSAAARVILRETFAYNPELRAKAVAEAAKKSADGAVQMDAVVVNEDKNRNPSFESFVARQRRLNAPKKPSLSRGAEIPGMPGVGVTPYADPMPFGPPTPRWSLIKLPW